MGRSTPNAAPGDGAKRAAEEGEENSGTGEAGGDERTCRSRPLLARPPGHRVSRSSADGGRRRPGWGGQAERDASLSLSLPTAGDHRPRARKMGSEAGKQSVVLAAWVGLPPRYCALEAPLANLQ